MKPFFQSFFKPFFGAALPTRIGPRIGKSRERVMMSKAGGPDGIRKNYGQNPDGSTTMLKTRAGMPQFSTSAPGVLIITVSDDSTVMSGGSNLFHTVSFSKAFSTPQVYSFVFTDREDSAGLNFGSAVTDAQLSDGVTLASSTTFLVPAGVTSFTVEVEIPGAANSDYAQYGYTLSVSTGDISGVGAGATLAWCTVNYVEEGEPGRVEWATRCI